MSIEFKKAFAAVSAEKASENQDLFFLTTTALTQPLQARGYYRPAASLGLFSKILAEMAAMKGVKEVYTFCEAHELQSGDIRLSLSLRTDRLGIQTEKAYNYVRKVFDELSLHDESGELRVSCDEMWVQAPNKYAMLAALVSVIENSNTVLLSPDRIADSAPRYSLEPDYEWVSPDLIEFSAWDHVEIQPMQEREHIVKQAQRYQREFKNSEYSDDMFLGLEVKPYLSRAYSDAGMARGHIATISVSLEHLFKTICQEDGSAYLPGISLETMPGGYH